MSAISRLYNFVAGTAAVADQVDAEFDQLVSKVNADLIQKDGSLAFAAVQSGIDPTAAAHLATKSYVDTAVAGGPSGALSIVRKTVDENLVSSVVLQNDDHLFFAMAANKTYLVEMLVLILSGTAAAMKQGLTVPAGCTMRGRMELINVAPVYGGGSTNLVSHFIEGTTLAQHATTHATIINMTHWRAVVINGATAGNFQFQWAQNTSSPTAHTVLANSWLTHQIAN